MPTEMLTCDCGAKAKNTSKERGRFKRRHLDNCLKRDRAKLSKQLAQRTRSVNADAPDDPEGA